MSIFRRAVDAACDASFRFWARPVLLADGRQAWHTAGNGDMATVEPVDGTGTVTVPLDSLTNVPDDAAASWPGRPFPLGGA